MPGVGTSGAPGGRYAAVDASVPWLELKTKLWFRDRGRAFSARRDSSSASLALARFTDSPVVSIQPDPGSLLQLLAQVRLRASTPSFVVRVSFARRHRSLLQFPQS